MFEVIVNGKVVDRCESYRDAIASAKCEVDGMTYGVATIRQYGQAIGLVEYVSTMTFSGPRFRSLTH
jgi:hypothetical protein